MDKAVIIPNINKDVGLSVTTEVARKLISLGFTVYLSEKYSVSSLTGVEFYIDFPKEAELIVVVGGDGSVIDASVVAIEHDIPVLGINLGRIGYLAEIDADGLEVLSRLKSGEYVIEEKMCLSAELETEDGFFVKAKRFAVNDVVMNQVGSFGVSYMRLEESLGNYINYRADGMIVATPQGSTAYSLSAGGPILAHNTRGLLVTPVCPHSFFNRSVLFDCSECLKIFNTGNEPLTLTVDGRYIGLVAPTRCCRISSADKKLKMITFSTNSTFTNLFRKMKLLEDI